MSSTAMVPAICADLPSVAAGPVNGTWKPILMSARAGIMVAAPSTTTLAKLKRTFALSSDALKLCFNMAFSTGQELDGFWSQFLNKLIFAEDFASARQRCRRRPRQRPVRPVILATRRIDAELCDGAVLIERLRAVGTDRRDDDKIPIRLDPGRDCPFDLQRVPGIDVVVDDDHLLDQIDCRPNRKHRLARLARSRRAQPHHRVQAAGAAKTNGALANRRHGVADGAKTTGRAGAAAEQAMLGAKSRRHHRDDCLATARQSREGRDDADAVVLIHAME